MNPAELERMVKKKHELFYSSDPRLHDCLVCRGKSNCDDHCIMTEWIENYLSNLIVPKTKEVKKHG